MFAWKGALGQGEDRLCELLTEIVRLLRFFFQAKKKTETGFPIITEAYDQIVLMKKSNVRKRGGA